MSQSLPIGSFQGMKSLNKSTILNVIRAHGSISRAEIAKLTKLTPPTVTNIVGQLLESRIIMESELGESSGGRKPIMLRINSSAFYVVGVYAGVKKMRAVTATLDGNIVCQAVELIPEHPSAEEFLRLMIQLIHRVMSETTADSSLFLGIGVGMHGLVNPIEGIAIYAPSLNLHHVPVKRTLEEEFGLSVEVGNDVRALALGESWFGQGKDVSDFICVFVGTGVGAGIILNHQLYHGASFTAGEMGHTTIDLNGPKCNCGSCGCLEVFVSGPAVAVHAKEAIQSGNKSVLEVWTDNILEQITGKMVHQAAEQGDAVAIEVLNKVGRYLGIGIANLLNTLNPSRIILSGGVSRAGKYVLTTLNETVKERAFDTTKVAPIVLSQLGENGLAIGAFTLLLHKLFTPSGVEEM